MPSYAYKAKNKMGQTVTGIVEAVDEHNAAGMVREMGHLPMDIRLARGAAPSAAAAPSAEAGTAIQRYLIYPLWTGVNIKMLAMFYRQLATLLQSGMSLSEAFGSILRRQRGRLGAIIAEMRDSAVQGGQVSGVMLRYPKVFSRLQISLVRAGEAGGLLESMVERIATYLEYEIKIRALIMKATFYPVIILVFAWLSHHLIPVIASTVNGGKASFFERAGDDMLREALWFLVAIAVTKLLFQFHTSRFIWDCFKSSIPIVGGNSRKIAMSRFSNALAVLYTAGMSLAESVDIAADACANLFLGSRIKRAVPALQSGQSLTEALTRTNAVSPMVLDMMLVGEKSGSTDAVLKKAADYMDDEVDASIHKIGIALFVLMILIAGFVIGSMVIGFWGKFYDATSRTAG